MLNDLLLIERGLAAHGIDLAGRHPDIKDMARGGALRVRLEASGRIAAVELVAEAGRGAAWTLRDGQQNGFPGLKTACGLLLLDDAARDAHANIWNSDKTPTARRGELLRLLAGHPVDEAPLTAWPKDGHRKRIAERLSQLAALSDDPLTAAVPAAFARFLMALDAEPPFLAGLAAALGERIQADGDAWLEPARLALLGPVAVLVDVASTDFERDAGDLRQVGPVSQALADASVGGAAGQEGICALTGRRTRLHRGNFPQPNLPSLGQTYLYARNKDIPSLTRYGRTADQSFSVGADLLGRLSGAITQLTLDEAKGSTWRLIPAETGDKPDLFVVSLAPAIASGGADAATGDDDEEIVSGVSRLSELGSRVIAYSRGEEAQGRTAADVIVLVLRSVDPANRKVVYRRALRPEQLWQATQDWAEATANAPDRIRFPIWVRREGHKPRMTRKGPLRITPASIVALSRVQFEDGGRRRVPVGGLSFATAFGFFLHDGNAGLRARTMLRLVLRRHSPLFLGLEAARLKGAESLANFDPKADLRRDALRSLTWIGAILHQLGRKRSDYMRGIGFRLGQVLAAADAVHIGYCIDVRRGAVPMTLIGNSVISIAGTNPTRALAILLGRWKPYGAWANPLRRELADKVDGIFKKSAPLREKRDALKAAGKFEEAAKATRHIAAEEAPGWAMRNGLLHAARVGPTCAALAADLKGVPVDDLFRAELLLGYMAGLPPLPRAADEVAPDDNDPDGLDEGEEA